MLKVVAFVAKAVLLGILLALIFHALAPDVALAQEQAPPRGTHYTESQLNAWYPSRFNQHTDTHPWIPVGEASDGGHYFFAWYNTMTDGLTYILLKGVHHGVSGKPVNVTFLGAYVWCPADGSAPDTIGLAEVTDYDASNLFMRSDVKSDLATGNPTVLEPGSPIALAAMVTCAKISYDKGLTHK